MPAATVAGLMLVIVGAPGGAITLSVAPALVHPLATHGPGLTTVMLGVAPCVSTSLASTVAVSVVALPNIVVRFAPSIWTVAPDTKPVPVTVSEKVALPAAMLAGLSVLIVGVGFPTVTVGLVAIGGSVEADAFANQRDSHWAPGASVGGTVNVSVALVAPVAGGVLLPFMNQ